MKNFNYLKPLKHLFKPPNLGYNFSGCFEGVGATSTRGGKSNV